MKKSNWSVLVTLMCAFTLAACGNTEDENDHDNHDNHAHGENHEENHENHNHGGEDLAAEGCEHMKDGPSQAVTAAAEASGTLEDVALAHTRVDITLADYMGMKGGFVRYEAAETGDYVFFVDSDVALEVRDDADAVVAFEEMGVAVDACAEVAVQHTIELEAGKSYKIVLGPTDAASVKIVSEHAGEHAE